VKCAICNKPITQKQSREIRKIVEDGKVVRVENCHTACEVRTRGLKITWPITQQQAERLRSYGIV